LQYLGVVENGVPYAPNIARKRRMNELFKPRKKNPNLSKFLNPEIKPGQGWWVQSGGGADNCDGTYDSFCNRHVMDCLLYAHNDGRYGVHFDSYSGWLVMNLENMRHGAITLKIEDWHPPKSNPYTDGWTCENNDCSERKLRSRSVDTVASERISNVTAHSVRQLKYQAPPYCDDFRVDYAVDGKITTLNLTEWVSKSTYPQRVVQLWNLLDDPSIIPNGEPRDVEFAIRMRGCERTKHLSLTHIYWV
jgi:hypothetical protein